MFSKRLKDEIKEHYSNYDEIYCLLESLGRVTTILTPEDIIDEKNERLEDVKNDPNMPKEEIPGEIEDIEEDYSKIPENMYIVEIERMPLAYFSKLESALFYAITNTAINLLDKR